MPKLVTWMNNQRVGELTKLANGAHTFKYAPEWLASRYARPLSLSLPLQRGNITSDAVFNFFDNLLPDSSIVRDRIVKRYHAKSRQPFDLLSEIGRDSVGAVTLIPEDETVTRRRRTSLNYRLAKSGSPMRRSISAKALIMSITVCCWRKNLG